MAGFGPQYYYRMVIYFGDLSGSLFALDAATGNEKWKFTPSEIEKPAISGTPAILGDALYYVTEGGSLFALDWSNGSQKWSKQFEASFYPGPIVVDDTLLLAPVGKDALVIALDANGNQKWDLYPGEITYKSFKLLGKKLCGIK